MDGVILPRPGYPGSGPSYALPDNAHIDTSLAPPNASEDNFTLHHNWNNTWIFGPTEDLVILPILLSVIAVGAIVGNFLVLFVIVGFPRLRTGPNLMLVNIALSDLLFVSICVPTAIINHVTPVGTNHILTSSFCKFVHYLVFVTAYVGIYTLLVTCVFRFCSEFLPTKFIVLLSKSNAVMTSGVVWIAFLISHLNFLLQDEVAIFQEAFICIHTDLMIDQNKMKTLWITFLACAFMLPILIICTFSAIIIHRQHRMRNFNADNSYENEVNEFRDQKQLTMTIMACMVARSFCWLPIQVFVMIDIFGVVDYYDNVLYRKAEMLGVCFALASSCVNPIVYSVTNIELKLAFRESWGWCLCRDDPGPEKPDDDSDMNETIMSIISDSSNHINYVQDNGIA